MLLQLTPKPYMKGPAVRRWQETCIALGHPVGASGADGVFGKDTATATRDLQEELGLDKDGIVGPLTWNAAELRLVGADPSTDYPWPVYTVDGIEIHDCRAVFKAPKNYTYDRLGNTISGVMLHRTACVLGENPKRWESINCHVGVTLSGRIILMHHFWKMIWHGNGPSPSTVGIEFDGNPEGIPGYFWKPGGGPHPMSDAQLKAAAVLFPLMKREIEVICGSMRTVLAHRQSSADRECDPGWHCWQEIALPWMEVIGKSDPGIVWGTGNTIPRDWDPASPYPFR